MSVPAVFAALLLLAAAPPAWSADGPGGALPRAELQEEDSHPHEIQPGGEARFHVLPVSRPSLMTVKCSLTGPAQRAAVAVSGMELRDWPLPAREFEVKPGATLWLDVTAVVRPGSADPPYFAFRNLDAARLLWHQCYNN